MDRISSDTQKYEISKLKRAEVLLQAQELSLCVLNGHLVEARPGPPGTGLKFVGQFQEYTPYTEIIYRYDPMQDPRNTIKPGKTVTAIDFSSTIASDRRSDIISPNTGNHVDMTMLVMPPRGYLDQPNSEVPATFGNIIPKASDVPAAFGYSRDQLTEEINGYPYELGPFRVIRVAQTGEYCLTRLVEEQVPHGHKEEDYARSAKNKFLQMIFLPPNTNELGLQSEDAICRFIADARRRYLSERPLDSDIAELVGKCEPLAATAMVEDPSISPIQVELNLLALACGGFMYDQIKPELDKLHQGMALLSQYKRDLDAAKGAREKLGLVVKKGSITKQAGGNFEELAAKETALLMHKIIPPNSTNLFYRS